MDRMNEKYEIIIGLEVHVELATETKIFCSCPTKFGAEPNTHCCPVCMGLPGALPVLNEKVIELAVRAGIATNCMVAERSYHDRKNYFYPDLPKGYQISQFKRPLCTNGYVEVNGKRIGITQIHIEEDAGKLIHTDDGKTLIDLNRAGIPLIEIVSEPDIRSANEAVEYLKTLRLMLIYAGVSECKMNEGQLRCDVNLSVRKRGEKRFGVRTEMKNINSFAFVAKAIEYEAARQIEILEGGGQIDRETRKFDSDKGITLSLRKKEEAADYRFFRDPDLPTIEILSDAVDKIKVTMPRLPNERYVEYTQKYALTDSDADALISEPSLSEYFESVAVISHSPKISANLILSELLSQSVPERLSADFPAVSVAAISNMFFSELINSSTVKKLLRRVLTEGIDPIETVNAESLMQINDVAVLEAAVNDALHECAKSVSDYKNGKTNAKKAIMGKAMVKCNGKGNPRIIEELLRKALDGDC